MEAKDYTCDYCDGALKKLESFYDTNIFDGWSCDICNKSFSPTATGWHCSCQDDGYDICVTCYDKKDLRVKKEFKCDLCKGALIKESAYKTSSVFNSWFCDICKECHSPETESWHCGCDGEGFDVCQLCYKRKDGRGIYWNEFMLKFQEHQSLTPEELPQFNEKLKRNAKHKKKQMEEDAILEKAKQVEERNQQFQQIMPVCLSETDSVISDGDKWRDIEQDIISEFEKNRSRLESMDVSKLLEIILKLQLKLGRQILETEEQKVIVQELRDLYEIKYVVDYPYQSKFQKDCFGLYTGEMVNKKRHGKGITIWEDGVKQLGTFYNDVQNGYGEVHVGVNDCYKGDFRNGEYFGHGAIYYPNGTSYIGDFQYHKKHGLGKFIDVVDGKKKSYYGTWRNGIKHGFFDVEEDGIVKKNAIFQANKQIIEGQVYNE